MNQVKPIQRESECIILNKGEWVMPLFEYINPNNGTELMGIASACTTSPTK